MTELLFIGRFAATIIFAIIAGKCISKLKLPAILGWLISGMILGPYALDVLNLEMTGSSAYKSINHIMECAVGLMMGTELMWSKLKRSGTTLLVTTLTQSLATFLVVSITFAIVFSFTNIPVCLGFVFGGIALATAPAPALSVVREFNTRGPVTSTLIPMAALDDIIGCVVFLLVISFVSGKLASGTIPGYMIPVMILVPIFLGILTGFVGGFVLKKDRSDKKILAIVVTMILLSSGVGFIFNHLLGLDLNFMLIGMAFAATFSNMLDEERVQRIMISFYPILGVAMLIVIVNLGAPLNYQLILGAGLYTTIYILSRAFGKYFGSYFGASITGAPETVKKYLGLTLLPHSGVSLIFTSFACTTLAAASPESANVLTGTIAAAAVINEIIAVILAKKGFQWAGELPSA